MGLQGTSRDVNIHNADSTTGRKSAADATTVVLSVEDKAVLDALYGNFDIPLSTAAANTKVTGNVASGVADSGDPVKVGGVYNVTPPALSDGQRVDLQTDSEGSLRVSATPDRLVTGSITGSGQSVQISTEGLSTVGWDTQGTWVGTFISEISYDGLTWYPQETLDTDNGLNLIVISFTESLNGDPWITSVAGARFYRLRATAWSSGLALITFNGSVGTGPTQAYQSKASALNAQVVGASAAGVSATPKPLITGGVDTTGTLRYNAVSASGHNLVDLNDGAGTSIVLGQHLAASSLSVVLASDQGVLPVSQSGAWTVGRTWTLSSGSDSVSSVQSGNWSVRLQDGAGTALTSSLVNTRQALDVHQADTSFIVSGLTAVGLAPTLNPVSVSGIDGSGFKRHFLLDATGKIEVDSISGTVSLPTGASTAANQTTGNTSLSSIDGKLNSLGQKTMAGSVPTVIASDQSTLPIKGVDQTTSGTITTINGTVSIVTTSQATALVQISGTWVASLQVQGLSPDGTTWQNLSVASGAANSAQFSNSAITVNGTFRTLTLSAYTQLRVTATSYTSGTVTVNITTSDKVTAVQAVQLNPLNMSNQLIHTYYTSQGQMFVTVVPAFNLATGGAENPILYFTNPSGSGKTMYIHTWVPSIETANRAAVFSVWGTPTTTANGTAAAAVNCLVGSGTGSVLSIFTTPTVSSNGSRLRTLSFPQNPTPSATPIEGTIQLQANNKLLLTGNPSGNNTVVDLYVVWYEV